MNPARTAEFTKIVESVDPQVVFTQWPVDSHADHRACTSLMLGTWIGLKRRVLALFLRSFTGGANTVFSAHELRGCHGS